MGLKVENLNETLQHKMLLTNPFGLACLTNFATLVCTGNKKTWAGIKSSIAPSLPLTAHWRKGN